MPNIEEMGMASGAGFLAPLGAKPERKKKVEEMRLASGDLREAHLVAFMKNGTRVDEFFAAIDGDKLSEAADIVREEVIRHAVRRKIAEVVRKKKGGGGYVLYAPNRGKKHASKPVGEFPTRLAAKRAELARFPPKDPKKLQRLRKEIDRLMKDPKKRAEAELRSRKTQGTDSGVRHQVHKPPKHKVRKESVDRSMMEMVILRKIISRAILMNEALGPQQGQSQWDEFISKVSTKVLAADKGYKRVQAKMQLAQQKALQQAVGILKKNLGAGAQIKMAKGTDQSGKPETPFFIILGDMGSKLGPFKLSIDSGTPTVNVEDATNSLTGVDPNVVKTVRGALAMAQDGMRNLNIIQQAVAERDAFLQKMEGVVDKMLQSMSPLQISLLKRLLVTKYKSATK